MKEKMLLYGIIFLLVAAAAAGIAAYNAPGNDTPGQPPEAVDSVNKEKTKEKDGGEERDKQDGINVEPNNGYEVQKAEGILTGRIDSHSVEIEVGGEAKAFGLDEALREKEFGRGEISFEYYVDENGRPIIVEAKFQEPRQSEVHTAEGVFNGLADNHTAEIEINGEPRAFGIATGISFTGFSEGDKIFIAYQENEQGRLEIIKIEKIF